MEFRIGQLIRWVTDYRLYAAYGDKLVRREPIYKYGIIVELLPSDHHSIVIYCFKEKGRLLIDSHYEHVEIISE